MPIDVELDSLLVSNLANHFVQAGVFGGISGCFSSVRLTAWIWGGASWIGVPIRLPVAVDIATKAGLVGCIGWWGLTILAPKPVRSLGVDKTCGGQRTARRKE